ncbi:MAG: DUF1343 domain-containing protein [Chthoniobacterales bacterium]|nr:MAG: DUF1343 domain-containing protein [Chthoniobacterales bacterium]
MARARNQFLRLLFLVVMAANARGAVELGIDVLASDDYGLLKGKRVGLITNQTGVDSHGVRTRVLLKKHSDLVALYTPEHGLDGTEKAGRYVPNRRDRVTGLIAHSLYGPTRKPTPAMLRGIDVLVFDLQDIGCRSYTYISTMGKCMEAAAENHIEFIVLDRPNPLGGVRVEGPLVEPRWISFVSQFPVPYVHGMTCGELARMINDKGWINGHCELRVVSMRGWARRYTWDDTGLRWVATSPNIPRWNSPFYYVATGLIGELNGPETGVGGARPFEILSARGVDAGTFTSYMNSRNLDRVSFTQYRSGDRGGSYLHIEPDSPANLTAINVDALAEMNRELRTNLITRSSAGKREMFFKCYGSASIASQLTRGEGPSAIVGSWTDDVGRFKAERSPYLLY